MGAKLVEVDGVSAGDAAKHVAATGNDAIDLARRLSAPICKHADPIEGARRVTEDEAREIARVDASLIYVEGHDMARGPCCCGAWH